MVFAIACEPDKIATMMDGLDSLPADQQAQLHADIAKLKATRQGIILGHNHLRATNKRIGERLKLTGMSISKGLDLEFEIVGAFPPGRYDTMAAFNRDYFVNALDAYPASHNGQKHPWAERNLSLMLLKVADSEAFDRVAAQIEQSPEFTNPAVRCETMASGHLLDAGTVPRLDLGNALAAGARLPGDDPAGDRQRHQHQRARAAAGNGRAEGARLPARTRS